MYVYTGSSVKESQKTKILNMQTLNNQQTIQKQLTIHTQQQQAHNIHLGKLASK